MWDLQIFSKLVANNWKKLKALKWINKLWYNGMPDSNKEEQITDTHNNMAESLRHYAE